MVGAGILAMFCIMCRDAALHGDAMPPRFGGIYEMYANSSSDPSFWGERWELYKVCHGCCPHNPARQLGSSWFIRRGGGGGMQVMYYTAQWTWARGINRIELFNEPELELCWDSATYQQQTMIR